MASAVTSGTTAFAFLNTGASQSAGGVNARPGASGGGFSDILSGQMRGQPGAAHRPAAESNRATHTPDQPAQVRDSAPAHSAPAAEKAHESSATEGCEHARPTTPPSSAHTTNSNAPAKHAHSGRQPAPPPASPAPAEASTLAQATAPADTLAAAPETHAAMTAAESAAINGLTSAARSDTDAQPTITVAPSAAESAAVAAAASNLAGLPAVIAALLPTLAGKHVSSAPLTPGDGTAGAVDIGLGAEPRLTGDTGGKSLQNLVPASPGAMQAPGLNGQTSQPGAQAGTPASAATPADQTALELQTAPPPNAGAGKSKAEPSPGLTTLQTLAAVQLQAKPDAQPGFAERAVVPPSATEDVPTGVTNPVMHTLRQPGQLPATTPQLAVATPAGQSGWADEVGNRVMWMVGRAESKAELVLTPPNLGKVEVSINLNGDQTTAQFVAATQSARDALEQAMPRLRELLAQSGISLGQTGVSTSGERHASGDERTPGGNGGIGGAGTQAGEAGVAAPWVRQTEGLVDTFA